MVGSRTPAELKQHYKDYQGTPAQIKKRAERNKARAIMEKEGRASKGDGKDVHHKKPLRSGGTSARSNLAVVKRKKNRGWET